MKTTIKMGKTVQEAVEKALRTLNASKEEVDIKILEEPKAGFLGIIGAKDAVVEVSLLEEEPEETVAEEEVILEEVTLQESNLVEEEQVSVQPAEIQEETQAETLVEETSMEPEVSEEKTNSLDILKVNQFLKEVLEKMNIQSDVRSEIKDRTLYMEIIDIDERDTGIIIGRHGETLDALQYLVNLVANRHSDQYIRVNLDVNDYRNKRVRTLESLAHNMAKKAVKFKKNIKLEPMNSYERRIIHSSLQGVSDITTTSEGDEPYRRVIIRYKRK